MAEAALCSKVWWQGQAEDSNALLFIPGGFVMEGVKLFCLALLVSINGSIMMLSTMPGRAAFTSLKGPKFSDMNQGLDFMGQEGVAAQRPVPLEPE
jgi:hypothetical protein